MQSNEKRADSNKTKAIASALDTTGELRTFLARIAIGVIHDDISVQQAAVAVKACEQINASLYSEIKMRMLQAESGKAGESPKLGFLRIDEQKDA